NSVAFIRMPKVALVGGQGINGNSFGFAWFAFDQRIRYPVTTVDVSTLTGPILDEFNVVVLPSTFGGALDAALGDAGRERLAAWVRNGGVLITLEGASAWLANERTGLSRLRMRRPGERGGREGEGPAGAPLPANVPGAMVRVVADTLSPLMAGVNQTEFPVLLNGANIFEAPRDFRPGEIVARYAPVDRLRLSGYLWPEVPERVAGTPYLWAERIGRGAVIAFANDPNFRDLLRGLLPVFANAVFMGSVL
ncbi:MAG TPA: hypothetical protein VKZ58_01760, partial [Longimicrobiales bacterium]|nr:hypothetical protein [Longimicrobiales bacterium]